MIGAGGFGQAPNAGVASGLSEDNSELVIWTVYDGPTDFPGEFVARKWLLDGATNELRKAKTLEGLRAQLPKGLARLPRAALDDPKIVETWM